MVGPGEIGSPGATRLLNIEIGGQVSWLLPLALFGIVALLWQPGWRRERGKTSEENDTSSSGTMRVVPLPTTQDTKAARKRVRFSIPRDMYRQSVVLWSVWLLTEAVFFSLASFFHLYYMVMLTPALCALAGIGVATMLQDELSISARNWRSWLLPLALVVTVATQLYILAPFPVWSHWLSPLLIVLGILITVVLVVFLVVRSLRSVGKRYVMSAVFVGMLVVLLTPTIWSAIPVAQNRLQAFPYAGPVLPATHVAKLLSQYEAGFLNIPPSWVNYLVAHQGHTPYLAATLVAALAAPLIVETGEPVMSIGGFSGSDSILSYQDVQHLVANGTIRYILMAAPYPQQRVSPELEDYFSVASLIMVEGFAGQGFTTDWIADSCLQFDPVTGQHLAYDSPSTGPIDVGQLAMYDCRGARDS